MIAVALALAALVAAPPKPPIVQRPIPFGAQRKAEMAAYSKRHYGTAQWRLIDPKVIVEHYTAIGIEHVGRSATGILSNARQIAASLALTRWLMARFHITQRNVIGHAESLSSPYHHELVASLRTQTHGDWNAGEMVRYRALLKPA